MRVVAGSRRGIPLKALPGNETRPTSDKVKESLFNIIGPYFDGGVSVELFGGSGSLSIEALSRGVEEAFIFERNVKACSIIKSNAEKCKFTNELHIQRMDAKNALTVMQSNGKQADLLFIDPPYAEAKYYAFADDFARAGLLSEQAIIICEHEKQLQLPEAYGIYNKIKSTIYGNSALSIYRK